MIQCNFCKITIQIQNQSIMRIAALYDIHGNLPALEAVLQEIESLEVDQILIGGDVVLGPMSRECLDRLFAIKIPIQFILGNCEVSVLTQLEHQPLGKLPERVLEDIRWTAKQMEPKHHKIMENWQKNMLLEIEGLGGILFCHATPRNETEIFTQQTSEEKLLPIFEKLNVKMVICGHTHMQFDRMIGTVRVVNAGSVGMSFGQAGAFWLLLDSQGIELRKTTYDLEEASKRILKTDYPFAEDFATNNVLNTPPEEMMLELLSKAELVI